jgi:hypothetical protein
LNAVGNKQIEELKGYEEVFKNSENKPLESEDITDMNDKDVLEGLGYKKKEDE